MSAQSFFSSGGCDSTDAGCTYVDRMTAGLEVWISKTGTSHQEEGLLMLPLDTNCRVEPERDASPVKQCEDTSVTAITVTWLSGFSSPSATGVASLFLLQTYSTYLCYSLWNKVILLIALHHFILLKLSKLACEFLKSGPKSVSVCGNRKSPMSVSASLLELLPFSQIIQM